MGRKAFQEDDAVFHDVVGDSDSALSTTACSKRTRSASSSAAPRSKPSATASERDDDEDDDDADDDERTAAGDSDDDDKGRQVCFLCQESMGNDARRRMESRQFHSGACFNAVRCFRRLAMKQGKGVASDMIRRPDEWRKDVLALRSVPGGRNTAARNMALFGYTMGISTPKYPKGFSEIASRQLLLKLGGHRFSRSCHLTRCPPSLARSCHDPSLGIFAEAMSAQGGNQTRHMEWHA